MHAMQEPADSNHRGKDESPRDLRLDACRGLALWFIFVDHVPNNIVGWLTLRNYGFSDATEVFVFVSGYTCMVAYSDVLRQQGWLATVIHAVRRSWEIYAAFLLLLIAYLVLVQAVSGRGYLDDTNTAVFFQYPAAAIVHAGLMQYTPVNTDVLPTFVLFHLTFPMLLWLFTRSLGAALALSVLVYLSVQIFGFDLPSWPRGDWFFNPLAWQLLFMLGIWYANENSVKLQALVRSLAMLTFAIAYLVFSLIVALSWKVKSLDGFLPQILSELIYPIEKSSLDPLRLLHFVSLAVVGTHMIPRNWNGFSSGWVTAAIRCGENSLTIYCLSVLLSFLAAVILNETYDAAVTQLAVSVAGIALMIGAATLLTFTSGLRRSERKLF